MKKAEIFVENRVRFGFEKKDFSEKLKSWLSSLWIS